MPRETSRNMRLPATPPSTRQAQSKQNSSIVSSGGDGAGLYSPVGVGYRSASGHLQRSFFALEAANLVEKINSKTNRRSSLTFASRPLTAGTGNGAHPDLVGSRRTNPYYGEGKGQRSTQKSRTFANFTT